MPLGYYRLQHVASHHGAGAGDVSSTAPYARDSLPHFLRYWLRFVGRDVWYYPLWGLARCPALALRSLAGLALHGAAAALTSRASPVAALYLFALPFLLTSLALMLGNWGQHAFLAPERGPADPLGSAYTCVNHPDNQRTFNDGYHATHHARPALHWAALPGAFMASLPAHAAADALVFADCHFFDVALAVLGGARGLGWLADRYVDVGQPGRTREQLVAELRRRLRPRAG